MDEQQRIQERRAKNRVSAKKCREKKSGEWGRLIDEVRCLSEENAVLRKRCTELQEAHRQLEEECKFLCHTQEQSSLFLPPLLSPSTWPEDDGLQATFTSSF